MHLWRDKSQQQKCRKAAKKTKCSLDSQREIWRSCPDCHKRDFPCSCSQRGSGNKSDSKAKGRVNETGLRMFCGQSKQSVNHSLFHPFLLHNLSSSLCILPSSAFSTFFPPPLRIPHPSDHYPIQLPVDTSNDMDLEEINGVTDSRNGPEARTRKVLWLDGNQCLRYERTRSPRKPMMRMPTIMARRMAMSGPMRSGGK